MDGAQPARSQNQKVKKMEYQEIAKNIIENLHHVPTSSEKEFADYIWRVINLGNMSDNIMPLEMQAKIMAGSESDINEIYKKIGG